MQIDWAIGLQWITMQWILVVDISGLLWTLVDFCRLVEFCGILWTLLNFGGLWGTKSLFLIQCAAAFPTKLGRLMGQNAL